jgi:hypothetical protein
MNRMLIPDAVAVAVICASAAADARSSELLLASRCECARDG